MSDFPGYPSPFSTWNQLTSARAAFPIGSLPVPRFVSGISSVPLQDPRYLPLRQVSLPDPLSALPLTSYRPFPPISQRYFPGIADIPVLGIEPSYGCSLQEPRLLLHSPNFAYSQNPSPLTFDQVYRSASSSSVSPVSQYRNQFDQRYVNSRLLLTGRLSEPLIREPREASKSKNSKKVHHTSEKVHHTSEKVHHTSEKLRNEHAVDLDKDKGRKEKDSIAEVKHVKLWNPFESDSHKEVKQTDFKASSYDFSIESLTKDSHKQTDTVSNEENRTLDTSANDVLQNVRDGENNTLPRLPGYPVKPIPIHVYDGQSNVLGSELVYNSLTVSSFNPCNISSGHSPVGPSSLHVTCEGVDKADREKTLHKDASVNEDNIDKRPNKSDKKVAKSERKDFNQNSEVVQNCNLLVVGDTVQEEDRNSETVKSEITKGNCETIKDNEDSITADVSANGVSDLERNASELRVPLDNLNASATNENLGKSNTENCLAQLEKENNEPDSQLSISSRNLQSEIYNSKANHADTNVPYSSPNSSNRQIVSVSSDSVCLRGIERRESVNSSLKLYINTLQNSERDGIKSNELKLKLCSPNKSARESKTKLCSPSARNVKNSKKEVSVKDELSALSNQVNEVRQRRNSINNAFKVLSPSDDNVIRSRTYSDGSGEAKQNIDTLNTNPSGIEMMASGSSAITMMKNSEDSLSASISSSHISESDSDTQLSAEIGDKLFSESHLLNTRPMFPQNPSGGLDYMTPLNDGNINCDSPKYFKSNNPQMCQSDNQKPYLCVQEQFNEKPEILPPYNCYAPNQSTNVLPEGGAFRSHDDESSHFPQSNQGMDTLDSSMDYDENSVMSEATAAQCESQLSSSHGSDLLSNKPSLIDGSQCSVTQDSFLQASEQSYQWDFLHSKQYIDNIYSRQFSCEAVKNEEQDMRYSDSPKTFIDLDTTTQEKKAQESKKEPFSKDGYNSKHYGKAFSRHGYSGAQRPGQSSYGNQNFDSFSSNGSGNRWNNFSRNGSDGMMGGQTKFVAEGESGHYEHNQNQYRNSYQSGYNAVNQGQNGGEKTFNQSGFPGNEFNQSDPNYYNQNQPGKGYQGNNYGNNPRYDNNYYNKGSSEYNSQNNMFPPNSGEMPGARYGTQGYSGNPGGYGQHYNSQSSSHDGSNNMGQYQNNSSQNYQSYQRTTGSPASTGSEPVVGPVKKKRGRKRKVDKEPQDENKPRPNTIVLATTNIGPLIDIDNPDVPIETYDYNSQIETIYNFTVDDDLSPIGAQFLQMEQRLCQKLLPIKYGYPVNVVYCPLTYAFQTHRDFVSKFCTSERPIMFLGMNPGPYGMSQNGVPFGEAAVVRDWLKITGDIYKPEVEHPKKSVTGLACTRNEVSGARFWGLFQRICKVPENFFKNCYVHNFCPQAYMSESGKNITPPQLVHSELDQINEACDAGLVELVKLLNVQIIIAVGKFVQQRASKALHNAGIMNIKVECILHPSPINPHANKGWEQIVAKQLIEMNVMQYLNTDMDEVMKHIQEWEKIAQSNAKLAE